MNSKKQEYRLCSYCKRIIPPQYDFEEHKELCRNVNKETKLFKMRTKETAVRFCTTHECRSIRLVYRGFGKKLMGSIPCNVRW